MDVASCHTFGIAEKGVKARRCQIDQKTEYRKGKLSF